MMQLEGQLYIKLDLLSMKYIRPVSGELQSVHFSWMHSQKVTLLIWEIVTMATLVGGVH